MPVFEDTLANDQKAQFRQRITKGQEDEDGQEGGQDSEVVEDEKREQDDALLNPFSNRKDTELS
ncbi:uncharacterized protein TRIREDRAFT_108384 [Trichoderma reesei QM6a]|uniref:Predicted protein n=2 Tax=Hypocrea jecorina TaxID=51453 RepID=G0RLY2_HYPJQ|nr:uncharacterized protein TRIREDRAFT_108384 [Trichoderma reesei QM6a]EGR47593.1 predicted protein [Trichoderma reesei QM6a]ETS01333.1 hypothetical protein M419DRAFT_130956 [Trichoderma reesei RUT C-30]